MHIHWLPVLLLLLALFATSTLAKLQDINVLNKQLDALKANAEAPEEKALREKIDATIARIGSQQSEGRAKVRLLQRDIKANNERLHWILALLVFVNLLLVLSVVLSGRAFGKVRSGLSVDKAERSQLNPPNRAPLPQSYQNRPQSTGHTPYPPSVASPFPSAPPMSQPQTATAPVPPYRTVGAGQPYSNMIP
ncbi:hypothetical protein QR680_006488 [Steinernema hermaphroditum]|uniref:Uncharacterized protein n=1 Tax=Steinernema hermaphroditum TaxID=289476 RepID=A0AA39HX83_9BILA|nr:hypothetical protein QR680_006488 [Steinernema hermaphroditum]